MIPVIYRNQGEGSVASYDWIDLADGLGYVTLYGATANISGAGILTKNTLYSDKIGTDYTVGGGWAKISQINFDSIINKPLTIRGKTLINVPIAGNHFVADTGAGYIHAYLRKVTSGTTVEIANLSTAHIKTTHAFMTLINLETPLTLFKKGDTLRLTVEVWGSDGGTGIISIGHDPKNRYDANLQFANTDNTQLVLNLPVVIDL